MRTKTDADYRNTMRAHQSKMKRLHEHHRNELQTVKNNHVKKKNDLRASNQDELHLQRVNHDNRLQVRAIENEKTYNKLQANLNEVKDRIQKTKDDLEQRQNIELKNQKALHDVKLEKNVQDNMLKLADANDSTQVEINRLARRYNREKEQMKADLGIEKRIQKAEHKNETQLERQIHRQKYSRMENSNAKALFKLKVDHERVKAREERKNLKEIADRRDNYKAQIDRLDEDAAKKKAAKQSHFEKDYEKLYKKHEDTINTLMKNKEKIAKEFTDELTQTFALGEAKSDDDFYKFGKLDIDISENSRGDGYLIEIPIEEHEADKVKMVGEGREIRVTMEREFSNTLNEDDQSDKMSRIESFTAKRSVEDILDPNTAIKKYRDGTLVFEILKA